MVVFLHFVNQKLIFLSSERNKVWDIMATFYLLFYQIQETNYDSRSTYFQKDAQQYLLRNIFIT